MRSLPTLFAVAAFVALSGFAIRAQGDVSAVSTLNRPADPVVLTGAAIPGLNGIAPSLIVGFRYDAGWTQIPVQADERAVKSFTNIYNQSPYGSSYSTLVYTDTGTFTGADPDLNFDADDELAFMAKDAGGIAPGGSSPVGVVGGSGLQVKVDDPLAPGGTGYVYLFRHDGSLTPGAGASYVTYSFSLTSNQTYLASYNRANGPNPENSTITTGSYAHHFSDRWISDEIAISQGGASNVDIIDRFKPMFAPGNCIRTEDSFSNGEGAFIANKSGAVRAIRSYIGANSGPLTQREHIFYAQREDIRTNLRVHAIASIGDFVDYSSLATNMTYYNSLNTGGALVNGALPDTVTAGAITWEMITGSQGSLTQAGAISTNIPGFSYTSYFEDRAPSPTTQCTGDANTYGMSGPFVMPPGGIPCTDPGTSCTNYLNTTRFMYFDGPGLTVAGAQQHTAEANTPLTTTISPFGGAGDSDGDGINDGADNCPSVANNLQENNDRNFINQHPTYAVDDQTLTVSDVFGDACDNDNDNDGLANSVETSGAPCATATGATNPLLLDTDGDRVTDGAECVMGSNPNDVLSKPTTTFPAGTDTDGDKLSNVFEAGLGTNAALPDSDGDGLPDGVEYKGHGSNPLVVDTDGDGTRDSCEAASLNLDTVVNPGDQALLAAEISRVGGPPKLANMDINKDGPLNPGDQALQASRVGAGKCP